jgi:hypothetical protein
VLLYSSVNDNTVHIEVELQPKERISNCVLLYYYINCTAMDGLKKCTKVISVATEVARNGAKVALSAE